MILHTELSGILLRSRPSEGYYGTRALTIITGRSKVCVSMKR